MKFALNTTRRNIPKSEQEIAKKVEKATSLVRAFAEQIMRKYMDGYQEFPDLEKWQEKIQTAFAGFPVDDVSKRLAILTEAITGFKPEVNQNVKVGDTFFYNNTTWACVSIVGSNANCVNSRCTASQVFSLVNAASYVATQAQTSQYAKEILEVKDETLFTYVTQIYGTKGSTDLWRL